MMKQQSKDPFEAAFEEQQDIEDSPSASPTASVSVAADENAQTLQNHQTQEEDDAAVTIPRDREPPLAVAAAAATTTTTASVTPTVTVPNTSRAADEEEDEENMDVELSKFPSSADPLKLAKMQEILSQFSEEQMSRYESFRRAGFQKSNMKRLLASISGTQKISVPMTIVVSGIAKLFVGEVVETARIVMTERNESGPIRPCHIREAYRRLKLEGKVPRRSAPRLFL